MSRYVKKAIAKKAPKRKATTRDSSRAMVISENGADKRNTISTFTIGGFPKQSTVRLSYVDEIQLPNNLAGLTTYYDFSANGCYDPNITSTGHQPIGFDQWMGVYWHYIVNKSTIKVRLAPLLAANPSIPQYYGLALSPTTGQFSGLSLNDAIERTNQLGGKHGAINIVNYNPAPLVGGMLSASYDKKKQFGDKGVSDADLKGSPSSNPAEDAIFTIWTCGMGGQTPSSTLNIIVEITYDVTFIENKLLPRS